MKKHLLTFFTFTLLLSTVSWGQILSFEFSSLAGNEATASSSSNDSNLSSSTISRGSGLTASSNGGRFNATSWALTSIENAISGEDYMEFTITPNSGYQFNVSSIYVQLQRSGTGPSAIALRSSVDNYASNLDQEYSIIDNTSTQTFTFTFSQANSASAVTYRIYMYAESTGGSGGIGDGSGDDLIIYGTVSSSSSASVALSTSSSLTESNLNGAELTLDVSNDTFVASPGTSDFTLNNAPSGTSISGITRNSDTQVTLTLLFDLTDFDSDISDFNVTANSSALTGGSPLTSNSITIDAYTAPDATTNAATNTVNGSATLNGTVTSNGYSTTVTFEYGITNSYGSELTASESPAASDASSLSVSYQLSGLTNDQEYHYRVKTVNTEGTTYGSDQTFTPIVPPTAWINEIHYDNEGTDVGEFIEIVVKNVSGYTLGSFRVDLYNGNNGASYNNVTLDNITEVTEGNTEGDYTFYCWTVAPQNGPDGVAISYNGVLIPGQFLSYEGTFPATDGVANGVSSTDIGVSETNDASSPVGYSLQLVGCGLKYNDFTWASPNTATVGILNNNQVFGTQWTGTVDSDWATSDNWNEGVPTSTINAVIPSSGITNFPTITVAASVQNLTIESDATLVGAEYLSISGTTTVKRSLSTGVWQYFTPPVLGATANDVEITTSGQHAYLMQYDNTVTGSGTTLENGWEYLTSDTDALLAGKGYAVWVTESKEIDFSGTLVTGNQTVSGLSKGDSDTNPWVLIGNSALAHLDWTAVASDADITGSAYIFDPDFSGSHYGTIASDGTTVNTGSKFIPPMQAFFVEVDATDDYSISFPTSALSHSSQSFYKSETIQKNFVRLAVQKDNYTDETVIYFKDGAKNGYQSKTDAHKLMITEDGTPQLYTLADNEKLIINTLNSWPIDVPLNVHSSNSEKLTLKALELINVDPELNVILEDKQTGIFQNLSEKSDYSFTANSGENENRFVIHFTSQTLGITSKLSSSKIYVNNQNIIIERTDSEPAKVEIYNLSGQMMYKNTISTQKANINTGLPNGMYLIKLLDEFHPSIQKIILNN